MKCSNCGAENRAGIRFCEQCAAPLTLSPEAMQVCPRCGTKNAPGLRFCEQCGAPLSRRPAAVPSPLRSRRRRWMRGSVIALLVLFLIGWLLLPVIGFHRRTTRSRPIISRTEALQTATEMVTENYPRFASITPVVHEVELDRDKGYRLVYSTSETVETDLGAIESTCTLVVSINAVTEEISVAVPR